MKKLKYLYINYLLVIIFIMASCTKLEREDYQRIEADKFFKTEADCSAAVAALYGDGMMGWFYNGMTHIGALSDLTTDQCEFAWDGGWGYIASHFYYTADNNGRMTDRYSLLVQGVSKATNLIPQLNKIPMKSEVRARYIAEVRGLRCNMIFWGYDVYGGISIMTDPDVLADVSGAEHFVKRATFKEMCDYVVSEVDSIKDDLPNRYAVGETNYGRITKGAVLTIKLKILMQEKRFQEAEATAREIMSCGYSLVPIYKNIFALENEGNAETILSYPCKANLTPGNAYTAHWLSWDYPSVNPNSQKWGVFKLKWNFVDTFDEKDERLKQVVTQYINISGEQIKRGIGELLNGAVVLKYNEDMTATGSQHGNDMIMYRYADVLLLLAEAINQNKKGPDQECIDLLNSIRLRAFPNNPEKLLKLSDYSGNMAKFDDAILNERGWELFAEFTRRQDLIRHGKFHETARKVNPAYKEGQMYFPIPTWIVDQSKGVISQNPDY